MVRLAFGSLLLLFAGCAHTHEDLAADVTELQVQLITLRRQVGSLEEHLQAAAGMVRQPSTSDRDLGERFAVIEAERLALRAELKALREELSRVGSERPRDAARLIDETPGGGALPKNEEILEVISVGGGDLLLVRSGGKLQRLHLVGVQAPRPGGQYEGDAPLLKAHGDAFRVDLDLAWKVSKEHLEGLLATKTARIRYDTDGARQTEEGIRAYVEVQGKDAAWKDLGASMIRGGFALAAGEHGLKDGYEAMQRAAATDGAGLRRARAAAPPGK